MAAASMPAATAEKTWLERLLGLAAEVRPGEAGTVLLLALNGFLILAAYYIIRPLREVFILAVPGGAEIRAYTGAMMAGLFLFIVPGYGVLATKVSRIRLINWVTLFFASNLVLFMLVDRAGVQLGVPFFLWVGIFNLVVVAQFWSFANDLYTPEAGRRLFAIVGFGGTAGATAGAAVAGAMIQSPGPGVMMLAAAGILVACLALSNVIHGREKHRAAGVRRKQAEEPLGAEGGFQLVIRHRYLLLIALLTLAVNLVNTNGNYIQARTVSEVARQSVTEGSAGGRTEKDIIGGYYANTDLYQNVLVAILQFFLVSRIFKYLGVGGSLFVMPLVSLCSYGLFAAAPILALIRLAKILENSIDYSLQGTVRRALFLPTSREAKYKALQAVETFFWRAGDMLSGLAVFLGPRLLRMGTRSFAGVNLGLVAAWLLLAAGVSRENRKLTAAPR